MKTIAIIPARAGSQGLPGKNYRNFMGKPLVQHTMEQALSVFSHDDVIVSSNCSHVLGIARNLGWHSVLPRPNELSESSTTMREVLLFEIDQYERNLGHEVDIIVLLQPTSPLRQVEDIVGTMNTMASGEYDMVMSVYSCKQNPYSVVMEYDSDGYLQKVKNHAFTTRQSTPAVYCINGAVYAINVQSLRSKGMSEFTRMKGFEMPENRSIDIDTDWDWYMAEKAAEYIKFA